ncbi:Transposase [Neochlamydia sp. EPS4]|uniref:ISL3 family transposase n=1 Tax=Neochlamydia sp. EPS4 TaxID=1478175 RepID=UPI0005831583|nr:ISL3 family transposase [Neochlamydia sp. EPS4]KIC72048.1 Transposase [Neochlamydia sp. EPS4]
MLNNDYLTKLINLEGVKFKDIYIQEDTVRILITPINPTLLCPYCSQPTFKLVDIKSKAYRDVDLAGRACYLEIDLRRFECQECCCTFNEPLDFACPYRHYTKRYEQEVYKCCQETTATYTGLKFGMSDKTAAEIYYREAKSKQRHLQSLLPTQVMGIDEIAIHKGHKDFAVVITDLTNKRVIDILKDRKKATLKDYMAACNEEFKKEIKFVAIDLWAPYRAVVEEMLPKAKAVADRFHVMQNLNQALDCCRKRAKQESIDQEIWKDTKYILLKNRENLTEQQEDLLGKILELKPDLKVYYKLKESFRSLFNDLNDRQTGREKLSAWVLNIVRHKAAGYYEFVKTLLNWEENILNYFDKRVSSGFVEGVNNKIKVIKRKAYNFVNFENFRIKIIDSFS